MLIKGLLNALLLLHKISTNRARIAFLVLDTTAALIAMMMADSCMGSVSATAISILTISILMACICASDIKEKPIERAYSFALGFQAVSSELQNQGKRKRSEPACQQGPFMVC
ncbi:hypothetical protein KQI82_13270 [Oscillibacter sp. MSJ-2]|uniref:Uncharacterized protein n=2 Tax=Dysosmobacter acutus TaxID=2841504 RepID=A0ABS6FC83_9FIRM|nr:hypothetical protein [Dysosmobacter acutus]